MGKLAQGRPLAGSSNDPKASRPGSELAMLVQSSKYNKINEIERVVASYCQGESRPLGSREIARRSSISTSLYI